MKARWIILALVLALAGAVVGCGGGDNDDAANGGTGEDGGTTAAAGDEGSGSDEQGGDGTATSTSSLNKAQFVKKASAACQRIRKDLVPKAAVYISTKTKGGTSEPVALAEMAEELLVPTIEKEIAAVRRIGAPAGDEEEVEAMLVANQEKADELKELKRASSFGELVEPFEDVSRELREYGFTSCTN